MLRLVLTSSWTLLLLAILSEVAGTTCMKLSESFSKPWPTFGVFGCYALSLTFLTMALRSFQVSVAYSIWAGLGTGLIACIGIIWFREPISLWKVLSLAAIIAGVIGLNLSGTH